MSSHFRWLAALVLLFACNAQTHADVCFGLGGKARRDMIQQEVAAAAREFEFVIVRDTTAKEAELRIPRRMLVAAPGSPTRTAMAGLALSAAFVGGGLWCMRFRGPRVPKQKLIVAGVLGLLLVGCLSLGSFADATPPRGARELVPLKVQLGEINVNVRVVEQGDQVELVVPPDMADKIAAR